MGFKIVPDDLASHAGQVDALGKQLSEAGGRGASVDLGTETFGILCQPFALLLRAGITLIGDDIGEVGSTMPSLADGLRDCADANRKTDDDHAKVFAEIMKGL
ncbi:hypothetical protein HUO13_08930 [Saccharopolyspora erythraea]|uniref:type VII secretion target n=1 Tax=Saccharopolyspora erythraea TaxID=1836 RepID=UPI001BA9B5EA|nr:type VII secretion target [Saccharopolyspora erythraea]QUH00927.1 hypothetical protein HUO13_08930 [Saccharopolyspora erythraea]